MDEKKLSGLVVAMTKSIGTYPITYILMFALLLGCAVSPWFAGAAEAAAKRDIAPGITKSNPAGPDKPVLAGIQVSQIGGTMLRMRIRGFSLPHPYSVSIPEESRLVLRWDGARFPQSTERGAWWDDYDWDVLSLEGSGTNSWWKQYDLPLLNRISVQPVDEDSLLMTFTTTESMMIDSIQGIAGADDILVLLKTHEPEPAVVAAEPPKVYGKGDPMGINAPVTL